MTLLRHSLHRTTLLGLLFSFSCGESSPRQDPIASGAGVDFVGVCERVRESPVALDEPSPLGFVPRDALSFVLGSRTLPMRRWSPYFREDGVLKVAPGALDDAQVDIELVGSAARLVESRAEPPGAACPDAIEADVRLTWTSADGAFAQSFEGAALLSADRVSLRASVDVADLEGRFTFEPALLDGAAPTGLELSATFTRYGPFGSLIQRYGSAGSGIEIASWPDWEHCESRGSTPAIDVSLRPSADDLLALVRAAPRWALINAHGDSAPLELDVTPTPRSACFEPRSLRPELHPTPQHDALSVLATLTLESSALPGPLRVPLEIFGTFLPGSEQLLQARFVASGQPCGIEWYHSPAEFVSQCGDWGVDLGGLDVVSLRVDSRFTPGAPAFADFTLRGARAPGCTASPDGLSCNGPSDYTDVTLGQVRIYSR